MRTHLHLQDLPPAVQRIIRHQHPDLPGIQKTVSRESPGQEVLSQALERALGQRVCREYRPLADRRYRIDIAIPDAHLAVEINGWTNHGKSLKAFIRDHRRTRDLLLAGWRIVPFTHREALQETAHCVDTIRRLLNVTT